MQFLSVDDIVLHVEARPEPGRPTLVLVNSLGSDLRIWHEVVRRLEGMVGIVRYDKRGHGLSGATPAPYRIEQHVGDLAGLLGRLGISRAVVCGVSVGGMIALGLAAARPELVRGLVLSNTAHRIGAAETWNERIAAVEQGGIEAIADGVLGRWFSQHFHREQPADLAGWRNMLVRTPTAGYLGTAAAIRDADLTAAAKGIAVPAICIAGDEDGATPPDVVRSLAALVPGARFELIAGAGHLPCIEKPDTVAGLIAGIVEEAGRG